MNIFERVVRSCLHMVRGDNPDFANLALGSGVLVQYRNRYFICTVAHFAHHPEKVIGVLTGQSAIGQPNIYQFGEFSWIRDISFEEQPDAEDLLYVVEHEHTGVPLDVAFRETILLDQLVQSRLTLDVEGVDPVVIGKSTKICINVDQEVTIDPEEQYSFFGRIWANNHEGQRQLQERFYGGLTFKSMTDHLIQFDLGAPISNHDRFRGCSGAPIFDTAGRLVALVTHGALDPRESSLYGYRFDKIKLWIEMTYFRDSPEADSSEPTEGNRS